MPVWVSGSHAKLPQAPVSDGHGCGVAVDDCAVSASDALGGGDAEGDTDGDDDGAATGGSSGDVVRVSSQTAMARTRTARMTGGSQRGRPRPGPGPDSSTSTPRR